MTYGLRRDTIAGIKQSALFVKRPMGDQLVAVAVKQLLAYEASNPGQSRAEQDAFKFYYGNHIFSKIAAKYGPHEPLPEPMAELARDYVKMASDLTVRLAYYCLMIIVREARNWHPTAAKLAAVESKFGPVVAQFIKKNTSYNEHEAVDHLRHSPPPITLSTLVRAISYIFVNGGWGGQYGGPPWGNVAETLRKLVEGEISPEIFTDTAYTLAHNNGPIFNKGMLYHNYDRPKLYKILDVQRAGMIPQLWNCSPTLRPTGFAGFVAKANALFPEVTGGYVDWFKVVALGALNGPYTKEKAEQIAAHGPSPLAAELAKAEAGKFYVMPGVFVKVYEREKAAA